MTSNSLATSNHPSQAMEFAYLSPKPLDGSRPYNNADPKIDQHFGEEMQEDVHVGGHAADMMES